MPSKLTARLIDEPMSINESTVAAAARAWFGELGYALGHGPQPAPG